MNDTSSTPDQSDTDGERGGFACLPSRLPVIMRPEVTKSSQLIERQLSLQGCCNARDLGGFPTSDERVTRHRRLFRSDALHRLTEDDLDVFQSLRLATLIDLRTTQEQAMTGFGAPVARGARHLPAPLQMGDGTPESFGHYCDLSDLYLDMLAWQTTVIRTIFTVLADSTVYPVVIHCTAGKDRTGVVAALILRVLGVSDDLIIADYAETDANMQRLILAHSASDHARMTAVPKRLLRAERATMQKFLTELDRIYGSVEDYLAHAGVDPAHVLAVRELLVPELR